MKILFCDASYAWQATEAAENVVRGKIAVSDGESFNQVDKVAVGKVDGLKQYINVFELTAVARAVELASLENPKTEALTIYTDSTTAMYWARAGKIKGKVRTAAHENALEYLRKARIQFGGAVTFGHVLRDKNPAGHLLAQELKKEPPHTL